MYLITGAGGFLGRYIAEELVIQGANPGDIYGLMSMPGKPNPTIIPGENIIEADIRYRPTLQRLYTMQKKWAAVFHCAAALMIDGHDSVTYWLTNAVGTENLLEWARSCGAKRFLYAHTHSDMNAWPERTLPDGLEPRFETFTTPTLGYGKNTLPFILSKIAGARLTLEYGKAGTGMETAVMRLANIRGVGSADTRYGCVFHGFIQKALRDEPIELWGTMTTQRDLIYVKDVASAFVKAALAPSVSGIYNVGSGQGMTIEDEAKDIVRAFSPTGNTPIVYKPEIPEVRRHSLVFDCRRARGGFGWEPKYSYLDGLKDMKKLMGV
jgi:UDP-glucose 4-epimerase